jgi:hypothetical protein
MSYNAEQDLNYIESVLAFQLNIIGLTAEDMDTLSIDEIITKAREFNLITHDVKAHRVYVRDRDDSVGDQDLYKDEPAIAILRNQRTLTISTIRRFWWMRQLALGAI